LAYALVITAWSALAVVLMAFVEYGLHRWPMHSKTFVRRFTFLRDAHERHAVLHHGRFYRERFDHDFDPVARHFNIDLDPGFALLLGSPVWLSLWFAGFTAGAACFAAVSAAHALVWSAVHREMHDPRGRWFSGTAYYRYVHANHKLHHDRPGVNYAVVLPPLVDRLFGTHRAVS
jgi:hypothetical protein